MESVIYLLHYFFTLIMKTNKTLITNNAVKRVLLLYSFVEQYKILTQLIDFSFIVPHRFLPFSMHEEINCCRNENHQSHYDI